MYSPDWIKRSPLTPSVGTSAHRWYLSWDGPLVPAVRTTQRAKWVDPAYKRYHAYKTTLRAVANTEGFPDQLVPERAYRLIVSVYTVGRTRYDLDNAIKGILDALFAQDRRVTEIWAKVRENWPEEHATIELEEIR